jgi:methylglutaconyl-CoA hydratase
MFDARQAERMGLLNEVAGTGEGEKTLEEWKDALKAQLTLCAPTGVAASKELIRAVDRPVTPEVMADTAARLSRQRQSEEGQAGLHAFLNKEKAPWVNGVY